VVSSRAWESWLAVSVTNVSVLELSPLHEMTTSGMQTIAKTIIVTNRGELGVLYREMRGAQTTDDCLGRVGSRLLAEKWTPAREVKLLWVLMDNRRVAFRVEFHSRLPIAAYAPFQSTDAINAKDAQRDDFASIRLYETLTDALGQGSLWVNALTARQ